MDAAKEKPDAAYLAKRAKASESAVDIARKYAAKHIVTGTARSRRSLVLKLIEKLKFSDRWDMLVNLNDEVENNDNMVNFVKIFYLISFLQKLLGCVVRLSYPNIIMILCSSRSGKNNSGLS